MTPPTNSSDLEEARFFYDLVLRLYTDTSSSNDLLNQKIHNMLVMIGTATLILTGLFYYVLANIQRQVPMQTYRIIVAPVLCGLVLLLIAILLGIYSYRSWTLKGLAPTEFAEKHYGRGLLNALENGISNLAGMAEKNQQRLEKKAQAYHFMLYALGAGVLALIVGFVTLIFAN